MSGLTDFLLARIAEELDNIEPTKVGWVTFRWPDGSLAYTSVASWDEDGVWVLDGRPVYPHSGEVFFDPEQVKAHLEAKRAIVEHFGPSLAYGGPRDPGADHDAWFTLLTLARPYAGHPDFMSEWTVVREIKKTSKGQKVQHDRDNEHDTAIGLTDFLLARIADDAAKLPDGFDCWYTPERYEAEVEVKRQIVGLHTPLDGEDCDPSCGDIKSPCLTLAALALPYADHPDWREEWRQ